MALGFATSAFATANAVQPLDAPMQFVLVHGDASYCRADGTCADWIAAEGQIVRNSPDRLRKILATLGKRKLPIVVRSPGGDVAAALEMGRLIRKQGLSIAVGGTRLRDCPVGEPLCAKGRRRDDTSIGVVYSGGSVCFSACPFMFAGGVRRVYSPFSLVGVHQITTTYDEVRVRYRTEYEVVNGKRRIIANREIGRKLVGQRSTTDMTKAMRKKMLAYFKEMGVDGSLLDLAMSATPRSIRLVPQLEGVKIGLATEPASADQLVTAGPCATGKPLASCIVAPSVAPAAPEPTPAAPTPAPQAPIAPGAVATALLTAPEAPAPAMPDPAPAARAETLSPKDLDR
jgi:hypothetical protein